MEEQEKEPEDNAYNYLQKKCAVFQRLKWFLITSLSAFSLSFVDGLMQSVEPAELVQCSEKSTDLDIRRFRF